MKHVWIILILLAVALLWLVNHPDIFGVVLAYGLYAGVIGFGVYGYIYGARNLPGQPIPWIVIALIPVACYFYIPFVILPGFIAIYGLWLALFTAGSKAIKNI